jgi:Arc/MetJ-type ribon-helix-helix transcriptional regulator
VRWPAFAAGTDYPDGRVSEEAAVEPATLDRIQRMIDDEAAERFPEGAMPRLGLLRYGDYPEIEPGELYLRVILGQDGAARDAWIEEHFDRLEDFRARRLPEVKGFMVTTDVRDSTGRRPTAIMKMDGISLLDPEEDELARGLTPVVAQLGPADLATLDTLITAGIATSRSECTRWALARIRVQPAYAQLPEWAREHGDRNSRAGLDRAVRDRLQTELDEQVKERFPAGEVQRVALLRYGDDPRVEPGDLLVRVFIEEAGEDPPLRAWERDHEAICRELHRDLAEQVPGARYLEFWFGGESGHQGRSRQRLGCAPDGPASLQRDLTPVDVRLGPADLEMLDTLITAGIAASRAEAIGWVLARIRERSAYARLSERARELDELKARF